jgi:hypothetical protein
MNIRAKCVNKECTAYDNEKSVLVGQLLGYGAPNDRVLCPLCGGLMKTTKTEAPSSYGRRSARDSSRRMPSRSLTGRKPPKRKTTKRKSIRSTGRRGGR